MAMISKWSQTSLERSPFARQIRLLPRQATERTSRNVAVSVACYGKWGLKILDCRRERQGSFMQSSEGSIRSPNGGHSLTAE